MKSIILGIETSCDETSAAVLIDGNLISQRITTQILHSQYGGVVPELASRAHIRLLPSAVEAVLNEASVKSKDLSAVAVTMGPGLAGALLVGVAFANGYCQTLDLPLIGVNHLEGHLWSFELLGRTIQTPFLTLLVSGGHTLLIKVKDFGQYEIIGASRDDAVGELFDKVGRMLGFQFPSGAMIDQLALNFKGKPIPFPRSNMQDDPYGFSFSGIKTAVLYYLKKNYHQVDNAFVLTEDEQGAICKGLMECVGDVLCKRIEMAIKENTYHAFVAVGGVAASQNLRLRFQELSKVYDIEFLAPPLNLCTDNAAMIANVGYRKLKDNLGRYTSLSINPALKL